MNPNRQTTLAPRTPPTRRPSPRIAAACLLVVLAASAASTATAQVQPRSVERRNIFDDPALRERVYQRMVDRYLETLTTAYELTPEQREQVAARLAELKAQQEARAADMEEMSRLRRAMAEAWRKRQAGEPVNEEQMRKLREQMAAQMEKAPLLNIPRLLEQVEQLLPAEQVSRGRPRFQEGMTNLFRQGGDRLSEARPRPGVTPQAGVGAAPDRRRADAWEQLVENFCREFQLDDAQRASAMSVLRDLQARRDQYRTSRAEDFKALAALEDPAERRERMRQLSRPTQDMHEELKTRLDRIPTSAQIAALRAKLTTRPADTRPADDPAAATQPARARITRSGPPRGLAATRPSEMVE